MGAMLADGAQVELGRPPDALNDSEEQDEPLAGQDHIDTINSLNYPLRGRPSGRECDVAP